MLWAKRGLVPGMPSIANYSEKGICLPSSQLHHIVCLFIILLFTIHSICLRHDCSGSFLNSVPLRKPFALGSLATEALRISVAALSIILQELNTTFFSHLLYISVFVSSFSCTSLTVDHVLINLCAMIQLVHKSVVSFLELTVQPHVRLLVTLADGKTVLLCSDYISLSCTVTSIFHYSTFFVAPLWAQLIILGIRYHDWENSVIDWAAKTLMPRSMLPLPTISPIIPLTASQSGTTCWFKTMYQCKIRCQCKMANQYGTSRIFKISDYIRISTDITKIWLEMLKKASTSNSS